MQKNELVYTSAPLKKGVQSKLNFAPHCAGQESAWFRDLVNLASLRRQISACEYEIECLERLVAEGEPYLKKTGFHDLKRIEKILREFQESSPQDVRDSLMQSARALRDWDLVPEQLWHTIDRLAASKAKAESGPSIPQPRKEEPLVLGLKEKIQITRKKPQAAQTVPVVPSPIEAPPTDTGKPRIFRRPNLLREKTGTVFQTCLDEARDGIADLLSDLKLFAQKYYDALNNRLPSEKARLKRLREEYEKALQTRHASLRSDPIVIRLRRRAL